MLQMVFIQISKQNTGQTGYFSEDAALESELIILISFRKENLRKIDMTLDSCDKMK